MNLEINNKIQSQSSLYQVIPSLPSIVNNITKLALPALGMWALSCIPTTEAGQAEYDYCMQTCPSLVNWFRGLVTEGTYEQAFAICSLCCRWYL